MHRRVVVWSLLGGLALTQSASAAEPPPATGTGETVPGPAPAETPSQQTPAPAPVPAPEPMMPATPPAPTIEPVEPAVVIMVLPPQAPAPPSFKIESDSGSSLRIGLLLQPQYMTASSAVRDGYTQNLFIRRTRILLGGTLLGRFEYFVDTDYPNLFLANNVAGTAGGPDTSVKATPGMNIQDAFATWRAVDDYLKIDAGYMLPPLAHNAVQGATTLYSWDYFTYTFQHSVNGVFLTAANSFGRDTGVQARGLFVGGHVEYRVGLFQGRRNGQTANDVGARNFFRLAARVQVNLLEPETGFFYQGTYLGAKKILSVGGSIDWQDTYHYYAGDVFLDLPFGPLGLLTAQGNFAHWNGGSFIPELVKQSAVMAEAGFMFAMPHLGPVLRFEHLWGSGALADQTRYVGGVAFWPFGHNSNVKAFYTRFHESGAARDTNAVNLQWQFFFY